MDADDADKSELLNSFFNQIETQVQFGDNKATLLVAGDALLLGIAGALAKMVSRGCFEAKASLTCLQGSWPPVVLSAIAALLLVASLAWALWAAKPSSVHDDHDRPRSFFLFSYWAHRPETKEGHTDDIVQAFQGMTYKDLQRDALLTILGKAKYATAKFRSLKYAVTTTLVSLPFMVGSLVWAVAARLAE